MAACREDEHRNVHQPERERAAPERVECQIVSFGGMRLRLLRLSLFRRCHERVPQKNQARRTGLSVRRLFSSESASDFEGGRRGSRLRFNFLAGAFGIDQLDHTFLVFIVVIARAEGAREGVDQLAGQVSFLRGHGRSARWVELAPGNDFVGPPQGDERQIAFVRNQGAAIGVFSHHPAGQAGLSLLVEGLHECEIVGDRVAVRTQEVRPLIEEGVDCGFRNKPADDDLAARLRLATLDFFVCHLDVAPGLYLERLDRLLRGDRATSLRCPPSAGARGCDRAGAACESESGDPPRPSRVSPAQFSS